MELNNKHKNQMVAVVVDDEEKSRRILSTLIKEYCPEVTIAALAKDVLTGIKAINSFKPDLVFLDIEMPNYSGFNLIEYFEEPSFEVVFTTAYDQYALKGLKASAAGYLLKPIDIDELVEVVRKVQRIRKRKEKQVKSNENLDNGEPPSNRIVLPAKNGLIYLDVSEICHLESYKRYTKVYLINDKELLTTKSLKDCMALLEGSTFLQIHRSIIINLIYIKKYARGRDSFVILDNDTQLDVGKSFKEELSNVVSLFIK